MSGKSTNSKDVIEMVDNTVSIVLLNVNPFYRQVKQHKLLHLYAILSQLDSAF